jgi:hypothetical protein
LFAPMTLEATGRKYSEFFYGNDIMDVRGKFVKYMRKE